MTVDQSHSTRPIFVVGSPRSGTSILTWCLRQHPNLLGLEESSWMASFAVDLCRIFHEDLVQEPQTTFHRILEFIGEPFAACCLEPLSRRINSSNLQPEEANDKTAADSAVIDEARKLWKALREKQAPISALVEAATLIEEGFERRVNYIYELDAKYSEAQRVHRQLQREFTERTEWALRLNRDLAEKNRGILELQKELSEREEWAKDLEKQIGQRDSFIRQLQREFAERSSWALQLRAECDRKDALILDLQAQLDTKPGSDA